MPKAKNSNSAMFAECRAWFVTNCKWDFYVFLSGKTFFFFNESPIWDSVTNSWLRLQLVIILVIKYYIDYSDEL